MSSILQIENLAVRIQAPEGLVRAVDGVSFAIRQGETMAIIGESGCGKSMTALAIMRLLPSNAGYVAASNIILDQTKILDLSERQMRSLRGSGVAMIFQDPMSCLNPVLTIGNQLLEVFKLHRADIAKQDRFQQAINLLTEVKLAKPAQLMNSYPHELSGGMKQRVMIAMALAGKPKLLIADEPTTALDVITQAQILQLLRRLIADHNMAMLLITHNLAVAGSMADHIALMYAGHFIETGPTAEFFQTPYHPYTKKFFLAQPNLSRHGKMLASLPGRVPTLTQEFTKCRFLERCYRADSLCQQQLPPWQQVNAKRQVRCHYQEANAVAQQQQQYERPNVSTISNLTNKSAEILTVNNLSVHYPIRTGLLRRITSYVPAVDHVSFQLAAGETLALVGGSGSGKSTIARAILVLTETKTGSVCFAGTDLLMTSARRLKQFRADLQIIFQDPYAALNPRLRIIDIIAEGLFEKTRLTSAELLSAVDKLLVQVGLETEYKWRYPHEFSGGQRQRICIARALAVKPKIIICDEPTSALDVSIQAQILNLLKELQAQHGLAYLFISHDISVVAYMADRIAVLADGKIIEHGLTHEVLARPQHEYTKQLLAAVSKKNN